MLSVIMTGLGYIKFLYLFIIISFVSSIFFISSIESSFAQKDNEDEQGDDKLIVKARINLENIDIENTKFIRVIGFINGEESKTGDSYIFYR
jgi:hypothetical protein